MGGVGRVDPRQLVGRPVILGLDDEGGGLIGQGVDGVVSAQGNRSHAAGAIEFSFPILAELQFDLAGRYDGYNTTSGDAFTGQAAFQYRPRTSLLLRSSIGTTFRAPDLQRLEEVGARHAAPGASPGAAFGDEGEGWLR